MIQLTPAAREASELAAENVRLREENGRLKLFAEEISKGYDYLHKYNAPDHKTFTGHKLFGAQWSNYEGFSNFIERAARAALAADSESEG